MSMRNVNGQQRNRQADRAEEVWVSRQEKVLAAKAAFGNAPANGRSGNLRTVGRGGYSGENDIDGWQGLTEEEDTWEVHFHFGLMRFMASAMLLVILLAAFGTGFSYHGFDRTYVQKMMDEDAAWNHLEDRVQQVADRVVQVWKTTAP